MVGRFQQILVVMYTKLGEIFDTSSKVGLVVTTAVIIRYASGHVRGYNELSNATLGNGVEETIFTVIIVTHICH